MRRRHGRLPYGAHGSLPPPAYVVHVTRIRDHACAALPAPARRIRLPCGATRLPYEVQSSLAAPDSRVRAVWEQYGAVCELCTPHGSRVAPYGSRIRRMGGGWRRVRRMGSAGCTGAALRRNLFRLGRSSRCIVACAVPEDAPAIAFKSGPETPQSTPAPSEVLVMSMASSSTAPIQRNVRSRVPRSASQGLQGRQGDDFPEWGGSVRHCHSDRRCILSFFWFIKHCFFILFMFFSYLCVFVRLVISHPSVSL
jgi:hypothetical protein